MHRNLTNGPIRYVAPWSRETIEERVTELLRGDGLRVAYLYEKPDASTFRYRVFNMVEALRSTSKHEISASWFSLSEIDRLANLLPQIDVLILSRIRYCRRLANLINRAKLFNVQLLADFDDLVFDIKYAHLIAVNNDYPTDRENTLDHWYAYVARMQTMAAHCDGGITTNAFLASKLEMICDGQIHVVPNFLNRHQEELSRRLLETKQKRAYRGDGTVTIGYFSGSRSHNEDFAIVLQTLTNLLNQDPYITLHIVGYINNLGDLKSFGNRVKTIPLQDYLNLQVKIAEIEVNIAPLQTNDFTHSKSELKFFDAAAVGTWTCATRTFTYERAISDPDLGCLTENGNWANALGEAVELARDPETYAERMNAASSYIYQRYSCNQNVEAIVAALKS
ncbi:MAG: glycosyl transferase family 1 [Hyphomicrobiales bacterium]|nr:MAG: glycosyl transferase family 1 [Hyphomicrobiales bacterium]